MAVALDAVTGLPLDDSYLTQYQIPLGSQPINLEELGALGRQSNWLYPDNLPGVVSRLQARDNTNPLNAQDLSTDGKRNLNVNIAGGSSSSGIDYAHDTAGEQLYVPISPHHETVINTLSTSLIPQYFYQISLGIYVTDNFAGDDYAPAVIYMNTSTPSLRITLWSGILAAIVPGNLLNTTLIFDPPLALRDIYSIDPTDIVEVYCFSASYNLAVNCSVRHTL